MQSVNKVNILVIDDDPSVLELVSDVLAEEGYAVTAAQNAEEAAAELARSNFDLVLSDTLNSRPQLSEGWLAQIRQRTASPILIFSAHHPHSFKNWAEQGFAGVISKPFDLDEMIGTVRQMTQAA